MLPTMVIPSDHQDSRRKSLLTALASTKIQKTNLNNSKNYTISIIKIFKEERTQIEILQKCPMLKYKSSNKLEEKDGEIYFQSSTCRASRKDL